MSSLMDDDAATADGLRVLDAYAVVIAQAVVIDYRVSIRIRNLDAEAVLCDLAVQIAVQGRQKEVVVTGPVDRAGAFILRLGSRNNEPLIHRSVEVETSDL